MNDERWTKWLGWTLLAAMASVVVLIWKMILSPLHPKV